MIDIADTYTKSSTTWWVKRNITIRHRLTHNGGESVVVTNEYEVDWSEHAGRLVAAAHTNSAWYESVAAELIRPGDRVAVDVGCGAAGMALALAKAIGRDGLVLAVDGNADVLAAARSWLAEALSPEDARVVTVLADLDEAHAHGNGQEHGHSGSQNHGDAHGQGPGDSHGQGWSHSQGLGGHSHAQGDSQGGHSQSQGGQGNGRGDSQSQGGSRGRGDSQGDGGHGPGHGHGHGPGSHGGSDSHGGGGSLIPGMEAVREALPTRGADLIWGAASVHHLADQQAGVTALAGLLAPGGRLALAEGGLKPRHLPWELGIGAPGLELRFEAAQDTWFARMRAALPGSTPMPYGWTTALDRAGLTEVTTRSRLIEYPLPLDDQTRDRVLSLLSHRVERLLPTELLPPEDAEAWRRLLDPNDALWLGHRDDLYWLEARSVHIGQKAGW